MHLGIESMKLDVMSIKLNFTKSRIRDFLVVGKWII